MKLFLRCLIVSGSSVVIVSGGNLGRQQAAYLRSPQSPAAATLEGELHAMTPHFATHSNRTAAAMSKTEDAHPGYDVWQDVVVPKEEADAVIDKLSKDCAKQSRDILNGPKESVEVLIPKVTCGGDDKDGSPLNCKMSPVEEECHDLKGEMCSVRAVVEYEKKVQHPIVDLKGKSCVPKNCVQKQDLTTIFTFARKKALEHVPDDKATLTFGVDCSAVGGEKITVPEGATMPSGAAPLSSALASVFLALMLSVVDW